MEGAHRRHEPDRAAGAPLGRERVAQLGDGADGPHAAHLAPASARVRSTSASNRRAAPGRGLRHRLRAAPRRCASSPRATGPVSARSGPSAAQFSTVRAHERRQQLRAPRPARGRRRRRPRSAAASSVTQEVRGDRGGGVVGGAARRRRSRTGACPAPRRARAANASASGVVPATAQPAPAKRGGRGRRRRSGAGAGRTRRPRGAAPAPRAAWRRSCGPRAGAAPATAAAAAAISASGTHSTTASQPRGHLAAPERALDVDAGRAQRGCEGGAEAAGCRRRPHGQARRVLSWSSASVRAGPLRRGVAADTQGYPSGSPSTSA